MALNTENGKLLVLKGEPDKVQLTTCNEGFINDDDRLEAIMNLCDFSNLTSTRRMFRLLDFITKVPFFDTSKVTDMREMFDNCSNLLTVPLLDTSSVTNMYYMFGGCKNLKTIPAFNVSNVTQFQYMFNACPSLASIEMYGMTRSFDVSPTVLEHDALVVLLNNLGTAYNSSQTLKMGTTKLALLSDDEKAIATNKGWTLA